MPHPPLNQRKYAEVFVFTITDENLPAFYGTSLILAGEVTADGVAKLTDGSDMDFGLNLGTPRPPYGSGGSM